MDIIGLSLKVSEDCQIHRVKLFFLGFVHRLYVIQITTFRTLVLLPLPSVAVQVSD
jgi:hypothetical protein